MERDRQRMDEGLRKEREAHLCAVGAVLLAIACKGGHAVVGIACIPCRQLTKLDKYRSEQGEKFEH